jgi:hypothetical protein
VRYPDLRPFSAAMDDKMLFGQLGHVRPRYS